MRRRRTRRSVYLLALWVSCFVNYGALMLILGLFDGEPAHLAPERVTYLDLTPDGSEAQVVEPPKPKVEEKKPEPEPTPEEEREKEREKIKKKKEREKEKPDIELEELKPPEPEEEKKEEEKEEEQQPDPEPVHFVLEQLKMVEQPDQLDEKDAPEEYNYLSNVNRDVEQETRAKMTNLQQDAVTPKASQKEPSPAPEQGNAADKKIAQLDKQESRLAREAPKVKPEPEQKRTSADDNQKSLLAMRDLAPRSHQKAEVENDPLANEADDGVLQKFQKFQASLEKREQQAQQNRRDKTNKFKLSQNDLDAMFGREIEARRNIISEQESQQKGIWDGPRERFQSPLENMVPEVQVGNQTALRSRKHPFARYIATIHRGIHDAWAWGFLEQLDTRGRNHPLNDYKLWTRLEIVLNRDGTIDNIKTVKFSGSLVFDSAAKEIVYAVGPFPQPPREIVSPNGKVYIHWAFHRDERACGTFGATPFILDGSSGDRPNPNVEVVPARGARRQLSRQPATAEGPAMPPGHAHPHPAPAPAGGPSVPGAVAPGAGAEPVPGAPPPPPAATTGPADPNDPAAKKTADAWLYYLDTGKLDKVLGRSGVPFMANGRVVAHSKDELRRVLKSVVEEKAAKPKAAKMFTAAGLRQALNGLPNGVQEGESRVYGLTKIGDEYLVLILEKTFGVWRVVGFAR